MPTNDTRSPLLTIADAVTRLNVSEKTVRRLIGRGELPALKVGGSIRLDESELEGWLRTGARTAIEQSHVTR